MNTRIGTRRPRATIYGELEGEVHGTARTLLVAERGCSDRVEGKRPARHS
jgi:hypothetical protein